MFAALRAHAYAYPLMEVLHLVGVAALLGSLLVLDLHLFGPRKARAAELARVVVPTALLGFCVAALSGLLMFATQAQELLANRVFTLKVLLLMLAGCIALFFHARGGLQRIDAITRTLALLSLLLWLAVLACGRFIAYR